MKSNAGFACLCFVKKSIDWEKYPYASVAIFKEVNAVLPYAVKPAPFDTKDGISKSGENYLTVQYEKLTPLLIEAIKELANELNALKKNYSSNSQP